MTTYNSHVSTAVMPLIVITRNLHDMIDDRQTDRQTDTRENKQLNTLITALGFPAGLWLDSMSCAIIERKNVTLSVNTTIDVLNFLIWRRGVVVSGVRDRKEVNARRARLVPGWMTVSGRVYHLGM